MNDKVFADTLYWVAVLNPKDQWHRQAVETRKLLGEIKIVTTETILIEVLNYFSEYGSLARKSAVDAVRTIMIDEEVEYLPHKSETFSDALGFYEKRLDKGYSLTDCVSMLTMKNLGLQEILTHDNHFEQEGFTILL
ncbi:MAG: type II toxin-antitoxin system VapC family toxin [Acidobacteria bacterium]|nr:type II toxin-antitoxin system VapC family toxin [Acidobacteriota bacterium]